MVSLVSWLPSFPPTDLGRLDDEEVSPGVRSLYWHSMGSSLRHPNFPNPEIGVGSGLKVFHEYLFSGSENVDKFLDGIESNLIFYQIPANLTYAYLKGRLAGRARDWYEVLGYALVQSEKTDFDELKQALKESFPTVRNKAELAARFFASYQTRCIKQTPTDSGGDGLLH
ncbi:uncharacterized protein TNCV_3375961 [Trichonephila clavipes]|nr:uncharacterized protein TNCV_3375961 [Trichonephila clavipes]